MTRPTCALILALACVSAPAAATDLTLLLGWQYNEDMEISDPPPAGTPGKAGDTVRMDDAAAYTAALDFPLPQDPDTRLGLLLTHSETQIGSKAGLGDDNLGITHVHFTGMRYYPTGAWEPFVMAGIGAAYFDPDDATLDSTTRASAHIAAGTNFNFAQHTLLRLEARWIGTFFDSRGSAICSNGCAVAFESDLYSQVQLNIGLQFRF
ncbi:hypothetical protein E4634_17050 [Mangrovimicrobium sediminis]|uniref:Uncharacterized protein n=1 Tax=Mangrovimicrobium sediminis TaxID=2562682 RepID=A0A4Z0LWU6_9GAMM|nr:outer membrane beta-barrel protein [Haliea sp. SAOS-164]TGD71822.1 hypothetical protein E4634_17050 [Haliea sp. SAOS-164]